MTGVIEIKIIIDDLYNNRPVRFYTEYAPSIRAERSGLKVMMCKEFGRLTGAKYDKMYEQSKRIYSADGMSPTIHTMQGGNTELKVAVAKCIGEHNYRIRKLIPKECWRLMGFDDTDFDKAEKVCSNTQLYKQAGNSCVINVLEGILGALIPKRTRSEWLDELLGGV